MDINSYCYDYNYDCNPVFRSNHCKSVSNYWLQEIAKDGSGGLLHRCAENDFIQFSHPYTEIKGSERLGFLTNLAKFADQQTLQDALQVTDSEGNTPLMLARKTGHNKVADLYEQWMDESSTSELETSNTETDLNTDVTINLID